MDKTKETFKSIFSRYQKPGEEYAAAFRQHVKSPYVGPELMAYQWLEEVEKRQGDNQLAYVVMGMIEALVRKEEFEVEQEYLPPFSKESLKKFLLQLKEDPEFRGDINLFFLAELLL